MTAAGTMSSARTQCAARTSCFVNEAQTCNTGKCSTFGASRRRVRATGLPAWRQQRQRLVAPAAGTGSTQQQLSSAAGARDEVLELLSQQSSMYDASPQLGAAVDRLIASNPCRSPGPETFQLGQGEWQVFHAPHIARLSSVLGARFEPITYRLDGKRLVSNVRYQHPLLGSGWLSAAGTLSAKDERTVEVHFNQFWWDIGGGSLRPELEAQPQSSSSSSGGGGGLLDATVGALGRAAFLPPFALFPVLYLDGEGLSVFRFPPLKSNIAVRRVGP